MSYSRLRTVILDLTHYLSDEYPSGTLEFCAAFDDAQEITDLLRESADPAKVTPALLEKAVADTEKLAAQARENIADEDEHGLASGEDVPEEEALRAELQEAHDLGVAALALWTTLRPELEEQVTRMQLERSRKAAADAEALAAVRERAAVAARGKVTAPTEPETPAEDTPIEDVPVLRMVPTGYVKPEPQPLLGHKVTIALASDWSTVYFDGELLTEGHSIDIRDLFQMLGCEVSDGPEVGERDLDHIGGFPSSLSDLRELVQ